METSDDVTAVLTDKIPLQLSIFFDTAWNNANKPVAYRLEPSSKENQIDFLNKLWTKITPDRDYFN